MRKHNYIPLKFSDYLATSTILIDIIILMFPIVIPIIKITCTFLLVVKLPFVF